MAAIMDNLPFIEGIDQTISILKDAGITTMIVATANQLFAEAVMKKCNFDFAYGTQFEVNENGTIDKGICV